MSRFNLRRRPRVDYYEPAEPNMDEYVFCDHCGDYMFEYCSIHGPLLVVPDDVVSTNTGFPLYVPRAALTIPHVFLHLAPSIIPGAGLGVFTTLTMPRGVRFGPYRGLKTEEINSMYCWQIHDGNNKRSHVIDAADANKSNWMRYVNCARHFSEQNLVAYQYKGQLYYRTIKTIPRFTELLIFYGNEFARFLNINLRFYNSEHHYGQVFSQNSSQLNQTHPKPDSSTNAEPRISMNASNIPEKLNILSDVKSTSDSLEIVDDLHEDEDANFELEANEQGKELDENVNTDSNSIERLSGINVNYNYQTECFQIEFLNVPKEHTEVNNIEFKDAEKKKFQCPDCEFTSNHKKNVTRHRKVTHLTIYKCNLCNQDFQNASLLHRHKNTHVEKKVYHCNFCSYKTYQAAHMRIHKLRHTRELIFKCDFCNYIGHVKGDLQRHIKKNHSQ